MRTEFGRTTKLEEVINKIETLEQGTTETFKEYRERGLHLQNLIDAYEPEGDYAKRTLRLHFLSGLINKNLKQLAKTQKSKTFDELLAYLRDECIDCEQMDDIEKRLRNNRIANNTARNEPIRNPNFRNQNLGYQNFRNRNHNFMPPENSGYNQRNETQRFQNENRRNNFEQNYPPRNGFNRNDNYQNRSQQNNVIPRQNQNVENWQRQGRNQNHWDHRQNESRQFNPNQREYTRYYNPTSGQKN